MTQRPGIVVLMTVSSPWSQAIVRQLAEQLAVHVVDFSHAEGYLNANQALVDRSVAALRPQVASLRCIPTPRSLPARLLVSARALRRIVRETDAGLVLSLYGGLNAAAAYLSGVRPYVVYVVGSDVLLADAARRAIARVSLRGAALVLANGEYLARRAAQVAPEARVQPLYLGVDLRRFHAAPRGAAAPRFVCTRGFSEVYDNATIVRAVAQLEAVPPEFELRFLSTGALLRETIALADDVLSPAVRPRVAFAGGASDEGLLAGLHAASVYLSASRSDGTSASLLEAMACRLYPIVSDIPANREWIAHGENGLLFPPGDAAALARCMQAVIAGEVPVDAATEANFRLLEERANAEKTMARLLDLIHAQLDARRAARG